MSLAAVTAAALFSFGSAAAAVPSQPLQAEAPAVMRSFAIPQLETFLQQIGVQYQVAATETGEQGIRAVAPNGVRFAMVPAACVEPGRCLGVWIGTTTTGGSATDVFAFEQQVPFINASVLSEDTIGLWRYEICDGGYIAENLFYVVSNLVGIAEEYGKASNRQLVDADPEGTVVDFSADALNRQVALKANFSRGTNGHAHEGGAPAGRTVLFEVLLDATVAERVNARDRVNAHTGQ